MDVDWEKRGEEKEKSQFCSGVPKSILKISGTFGIPINFPLSDWKSVVSAAAAAAVAGLALSIVV